MSEVLTFWSACLYLRCTSTGSAVVFLCPCTVTSREGFFMSVHLLYSFLICCCCFCFCFIWKFRAWPMKKILCNLQKSKKNLLTIEGGTDSEKDSDRSVRCLLLQETRVARIFFFFFWSHLLQSSFWYDSLGKEELKEHASHFSHKFLCLDINTTEELRATFMNHSRQIIFGDAVNSLSWN